MEISVSTNQPHPTSGNAESAARATEPPTSEATPALVLADQFLKFPHTLYADQTQGGTQISVGNQLIDAPARVDRPESERWDALLNPPAGNGFTP